MTEKAPTLELINQQHEELYQKLRSLANRLQTGLHPGAELAAAFQDLYRFMLVHFRTEEAFMDRIGYPDAEGHRSQHEDLVETMAAVQRALQAGAEYSPQDQHTLRSMVENHTRQTDSLFMLYHGVQGDDGNHR